MEDLSKVIMNPVRMRIAQYLLIHHTGTASQISEELSDVPKASLYRHMKVLEDSKLIVVDSENRIRGTVEKVYKINTSSPGGEFTPEKGRSLVSTTLLGIMGEFERYFRSDDVNPVRDRVALTTSVLMLSDDEFTEFNKKLAGIYNEYLGNKPTPDRKARKLTFISLPADNK